MVDMSFVRWLYTAITRAKKSVEIWGTEQVFRNALSQTTRRESGLRDMIRSGKDETGETSEEGSEK